MRSKLGISIVVVVALLALYLVAWPVPIQPVAWQPPPAPGLVGPYAVNDRLRAVEWLGRGVALGPESTAIDAQGRVYTGTSDGRILRLAPGQTTFEKVADTGGRPLGMTFDQAGRLIVCDSSKGLLALGSDGKLTTLATEQGGVRFGFTDDVDVGPDGTIYFTDASSRFGQHQYREDILEHGGHGRLLAYHPESGAVDLLTAGLQFANGVAVAGDGSFVAVNETGSYRVLRYWLTGPRKGTLEPLFENLPGMPDNITYSPARHAFWVALFSPRVGALDALATHPFLRKLVMRLPSFTQPQPTRHAFALAIDETGRVVESMQDASPGAYAPVTSVRERDGVLWLGSLEREALGRIPAPPLPAGEGHVQHTGD